jgi:hypothetical protein
VDPEIRPWVLHEHPERPIDRWAWVCMCSACALAVRAASISRPSALACIKTDVERELITLAELAVRLSADATSGPSRLSRLSEIREIFVVAA